jgi:hypothetical protein
VAFLALRGVTAFRMPRLGILVPNRLWRETFNQLPLVAVLHSQGDHAIGLSPEVFNIEQRAGFAICTIFATSKMRSRHDL